MDPLTIISTIGSLFGSKKSSQPAQQQYQPMQRYDVTAGMQTMPAGQAPVHNPSPAATTFGYKPAGTQAQPKAPAIVPLAGAPIAGDPNTYLQQQAEQRKQRAALAMSQFNMHTEMARENPFYGGGLMLGRALFAPKTNGNTPEQNIW